MDALKLPRGTHSITLPAGSELVVDRIYIRQDAPSFESVTFIVKDHPDIDVIGQRFWVKLPDANTIDGTHTSSGNPIGFGASAYRTLAKAKVDPTIIEKAKRRKEAKAEVDSIREQLVIELQISQWDNNLKHIRSHMDGMINSCYMRYKNHNWIACMLSSDSFKDRHLSYLTSERYWVCSKSKKQNDGSIVRDFFIESFFEKKDGGFQVTSKDGKLISVTPIP